MFVCEQKTSRSGSQGEEELVESDAIVPQKVKSKAKKKRGPGKAKKRIPSDEDYEPLKVSRRVRSKSRLTVQSILQYFVLIELSFRYLLPFAAIQWNPVNTNTVGP